MASVEHRPLALAAGLPEQECALLRSWLEAEGWAFGQAPGSARQCMTDEAAVVLVDGDLLLSQPQWLDEAGRAGFTPAVVAVVARGGVKETVEALRSGASDCLVRPLQADKALLVLRHAAELKALQGRVESLRGGLDKESVVSRIVGESPAMRQALALAARAAALPVDVLIRGETGTGKELFARALHSLSGRSQGPFVAVDCGALPAELVDSLFFGHRKGAFTGATEDRPGLLEQAEGGTLFLDEVGNLPADAQAKLLRALQTRETWRLGGLQSIPLDIRVLAATHSDLEAEAKAGRFRLDLFHRLQDFPLSLPPLRERDGDVTLLAQLFILRHRVRFNLPPLSLDDEVLKRIQDYPWPGNVRQLENAMKHAAVMASDIVHLQDLPQELCVWEPKVAGPGAVIDKGIQFILPEGLMPLWQAEKLVVCQLETRLIGEALAACGGDRPQAAALLDLHPKTLLKKIKEYALV